MSKSKSCLRIMAVAVSLMLCTTPLFAQGGGRVCSIKNIMGSVKVFTSRNTTAKPDDVSTWADAQVNMPLREKDMIATLAGAEVRLETANGSAVRLRENTVLELSALKQDGSVTKLKLLEGSIVTDVQMLASRNSSFEFETPTSVAAVRGTKVEVDARKGYGTTYKTFDGTLEAGAKNSKAPRQPVGNYQMMEVNSGNRADKTRAIPKHYRPKNTKLLSEEDMAALTGFTRVLLTYGEMMETKRQLEDDGIVCAIGMAVGDNEMVARTMSEDEARKALAVSLDTRVQRLSEAYAQNVNGDAKKIWEEGVRQLTDVSVRGTSVHTTIAQHNEKTGQFRIYSLMVMAPERFKDVFLAETERHEEFELRVKKDDMMRKMDESINAYNTKYHDR